MNKSTPSANISDELQGILVYIPDLLEWPDSWMIDDPDRVIGKAIITTLIPFIEHLIEQGLTKRTIRRHVDNLWALGGDIITAINWDESLRERPARELVLGVINNEGGPLLHNPFDPSDQKTFDTTCRKLYKFLLS